MTMSTKVVCSTKSHAQSGRGFTTIELMVVMAITAVLAAMAAPSFNNLLQRMRIDAAFEALSGTIQFARTEAIRNARQVNIDRSACAFNDWSCGWIVYIDQNQNNAQDLPNEPTIKQVNNLDGTRITKVNNPNQLLISRFGQFATVGNTTFSIGPRNATTADCKTLVLNTAMRQTSTTSLASCPPP